MVFKNELLSLFETKTPYLSSMMWLISLNIITGLNLARDSSKTFGWASVKEGKTVIL